MQKVKMIAQGRVQGVGFRWGVYTLALELLYIFKKNSRIERYHF